MSELPELHRAYPRPSAAELDVALARVTSRAAAGVVPWRTLLRVAAMAAGLAIAYGAGFAMGQHRTAGVTQQGIRPPVLIAGPRS